MIGILKDVKGLDLTSEQLEKMTPEEVWKKMTPEQLVSERDIDGILYKINVLGNHAGDYICWECYYEELYGDPANNAMMKAIYNTIIDNPKYEPKGWDDEPDLGVMGDVEACIEYDNVDMADFLINEQSRILHRSEILMEYRKKRAAEGVQLAYPIYSTP